MTESEWLTNTDPLPMLWYIAGKFSDRKRRLFACACARQVSHLFTYEQSWQAVDAAEKYADGLITAEELVAAHDKAISSANDASRSAVIAADFDAEYAARHTAIWASSVTSMATEWNEAVAAKRAHLLRAMVRNPFRPANIWRSDRGLHPIRNGSICLQENYLTGDVLSLAHAAYDERLPDGSLDPARLAVLSDALEDAGAACFWCDGWGIDTLYNEKTGRTDHVPCPDCGGTGQHPITVHLRSPGPLYRGCWSVDLLLAKR